MRWSRPRRAAVAAVTVVGLAGGGIAGCDGAGPRPRGVVGDHTRTAVASATTGGTRTPAPHPPPPDATHQLAAGAVLPGLVPAPVATAGGVTRTLAPLLRDPALGRSVSAAVLDAQTGESLLAHQPGVPRTPASLAKLATGAAALLSMPQQRRLATRVVTGVSAGEVVLVGGGDPMLTVAQQPAAAYPRRASLQALAGATAVALRRRGRVVAPVRVRVDDSLFAGPAVAPVWPRGYVASGVVAPVSALMVDGARLRAGRRARATDPALHAGGRFAALLRVAGVPVAGVPTRARAPAGAQQLAVVVSPPVGVLVEHMLLTSDNDVAEALWRHVAIARGAPVTFAGGWAATTAQLQAAGIDTRQLRLLDGSGLARASLLTPGTLTGLLRVAIDRPQLRPLLTGLPVARFTGTLTRRFGSPAARAGVGVVRAKTGSLTGVASLAGVVVAGGRLITFAVLADRVPPAAAFTVRDRLDRVAAALASCGCR